MYKIDIEFKNLISITRFCFTPLGRSTKQTYTHIHILSYYHTVVLLKINQLFILSGETKPLDNFINQMYNLSIYI